MIEIGLDNDNSARLAAAGFRTPIALVVAVRRAER
jgi:hypothetical protein